MGHTRCDLVERTLPFIVMAFRLAIEESEKLSGQRMPPFGHNPEKCWETVIARKDFTVCNEDKLLM